MEFIQTKWAITNASAEQATKYFFPVTAEHGRELYGQRIPGFVFEDTMLVLALLEAAAAEERDCLCTEQHADARPSLYGGARVRLLGRVPDVLVLGNLVACAIAKSQGAWEVPVHFPDFCWGSHHPVFTHKGALFAAVEDSRRYLACAAQNLRDDRAILFVALRSCGVALEFVPEKRLEGGAMVMIVAAAVRQPDGDDVAILPRSSARANLARDERGSMVIGGLGPRCRERIEGLGDRCTYVRASERLRGDREFVSMAIRTKAWPLQNASAELRGDKEIALLAVKQSGLALGHVSEHLRNDRGVVLAAVGQNGCALKHAPEPLRNDKEVVLAALEQNGLALEHVSKPLRHDRGVVLAAVAQNGHALAHASEGLRSERSVVLTAMSTHKAAAEFVLSYATRKVRDVLGSSCGV